MPRIRLIALVFWVVLVVTLSAVYAINPDLLAPENILAALWRSGQPVLLGYVVLNVVRGFTLIPSTVLILVGMLLFPDRPVFVMVSSLAGIVASAALIYFFFEFLGVTQLLERRHAARIRWLEDQMRRKGFWVVVAWSAFPFVPTDAICYVAGTLSYEARRLPVWRGTGRAPDRRLLRAAWRIPVRRIDRPAACDGSAGVHPLPT